MSELQARSGIERMPAAFSPDGRKAALMPYLMGGFPTLEASRRVGDAYVDAGADLVEVGVPFSDPLADGPAIQEAGQRALAAGATFDGVLREVAEPLAQRLPVILMCYANLIFARGFETVADALAGRGVAGLIVPDLPALEAGELRRACDARGVALVPLVAPTTSREGIEAIGAAARGFVYVVSVAGVTGERKRLPPELGEAVQRVRAASEVPVAVGFGVASPDQAAEVAALADGVIIGSRLVRAIGEAPGLEAGIADVDRLLRELAGALARP